MSPHSALPEAQRAALEIVTGVSQRRPGFRW